MSKHNWTLSDIPDQKGKIVIITGANSGVGFEAVKALSKKNATIVMAVRSLDKGEEALAKLSENGAETNVSLMQLDLSDLDSVHHFALAFKAKYDRLDILMNNAGVMYPAKKEITKQGFELQVGTNHLGHFTLTGLLLDVIKNTAHSRVVMQSSLAHINARIRLDDLNWEKAYSKMGAYGQSKLANLLFTYELDRRLKANHIDAMATAAHPGVSKTNLMRTSGFIIELFTPLVAQNAEMGALPILRAATDEQLKGGEYIGPDKMLGLRGYPIIIKSNRKSYDVQLAEDLWTLSEKMTGVHFDF
jgi:NAD(P)-dependent dehydrogenase (short-subunit alcohol dehydrogenase family)